MIKKISSGINSSFKLELIAYCLCVIFIISVYSDYFRLNVYGHDEVHYYENFRFKLIEEGRWINYLLHDTLRTVPLHVWSILLVSIAFIFFYSLLIDTFSSKPICALFATCVITSPPFISQSLWPATFAPSIVSLLILLNVKNEIGYRITYLVAGILLFGGLQNLYFIIPLLFINDFLSSDACLKTIYRHFSWWIAGCIAGISTSLIMVFFITGQVGLEIAEWRQTKPIHDLPSAITNLNYIIRSFSSHLYEMINQFRIFLYLPLLVTAVLINFALRKQYVYMLLVILGVSISYFAFSLPLSPVIQERTLIPLYMSVVLALIVFSNAKFCNSLNILNLTIFCIVNFIYGSAYIKKHQEITDHYFNSIYRTLDRNANQFTSIVLKGKLSDQHENAYFFNSAPLMHSVIYALGAYSYWDCRTGTLDPRCKLELDPSLKNITAMDGGELMLLVDEGRKIAILDFSPHQSR